MSLDFLYIYEYYFEQYIIIKYNKEWSTCQLYLDVISYKLKVVTKKPHVIEKKTRCKISIFFK